MKKIFFDTYPQWDNDCPYDSLTGVDIDGVVYYKEYARRPTDPSEQHLVEVLFGLAEKGFEGWADLEKQEAHLEFKAQHDKGCNMTVFVDVLAQKLKAWCPIPCHISKFNAGPYYYLDINDENFAHIVDISAEVGPDDVSVEIKTKLHDPLSVILTLSGIIGDAWEKTNTLLELA
ncbi:MAG: hypothetical protein KatS3mg045_1922 [Bellilinea sp.]|nr:MAG: hypothetical protein KatS3mg045_1922 [Bellilinea sp.]